MNQLNLPQADLKIRQSHEKSEVFDVIRKRYVKLTNEEWVRQHFIHYLVREKQVPASLIGVETSIKYNRMSKRCDIVVFDNGGKSVMIVECKAPEVNINQEVFNQVALYNMTLKVNFLVVTNGLDHYVAYIDHEKRSFLFLNEIPDYNLIVAPTPPIL